MTLYRGTVAVVTGAASGIGKALANNTIPKSQIIADFNK
ncbi:MAG: NADP-dependent 3-hydroxy acid dehydrogenase YdfG [Paraglaciecola sp.]|jgi:NADP-dependent 3-hydroxy acid dehydrogenase YdfG